MVAFTTYSDFSKSFLIYNREADDDLRCLTIQRSKVIKDVSLTLSSYDRFLYLSRQSKFKEIVAFG